MFKILKAKARELKRYTLIVYFVARDKRTPFWVRILALVTTAYALSPIDLIPDFIPVLGYLDDLLLIPLALAIIIRLTPPDVLADAKLKADKLLVKPASYLAAAIIFLIWACVIGLLIVWLWPA